VTYGIERVYSCVADLGQATYRLTCESNDVSDLHVWRHVLVHEQKLNLLAPAAEVSTLRLTDRQVLVAGALRSKARSRTCGRICPRTPYPATTHKDYHSSPFVVLHAAEIIACSTPCPTIPKIKSVAASRRRSRAVGTFSHLSLCTYFYETRCPGGTG
jgi:hypothetical protein